MPDKAIFGADLTLKIGGDLTTTPTVRHNLAVHHLMAAAMYARNVHAAEAKRGDPFGPYFDEIRWQVMTCVMVAVAAVEAHFNERMAQLKVDNLFLKRIERKGFLSRHDLYLEFANLPELDSDATPTWPFADLVELRNALVHFRPEWDDDQVLHAELDERLAGQFPTSPFFDSTTVFFPMRCMSHGCAAWAVRCAQEFGDAFAERIGVQPKFRPLGDRLATE